MAKRTMIIHDETGDMADALEKAAAIVRKGLVSEGRRGPQYCFLSAFRGGVDVASVRNKTSDTMWVYRNTPTQGTQDDEQ